MSEVILCVWGNLIVFFQIKLNTFNTRYPPPSAREFLVSLIVVTPFTLKSFEF